MSTWFGELLLIFGLYLLGVDLNCVVFGCVWVVVFCLNVKLVLDLVWDAYNIKLSKYPFYPQLLQPAL